MRFEKWQALGNDYVIVERESFGMPLTPAVTRRLCARHLGIGADGILELMPPSEDGFVAQLRILNPDGSEFARLVNRPLSLINPYDSPANIAFDGQGNLLLTNHAFVTGQVLPSQFQILKVFVGDVASPLAEPLLP